MSGTRFSIEVQPVIPKALIRLEELANDLVYSWSRPVRRLFAHLDRELWRACGHNPKVFLHRVALIYRVGYFNQTIDGQGNQQLYICQLEFADLPIAPVLDAQGHHLIVQVDLPGRRLDIAVWQAVLGHIRLFLLDTDTEANSPEDRRITRQLY